MNNTDAHLQLNGNKLIAGSKMFTRPALFNNPNKLIEYSPSSSKAPLITSGSKWESLVFTLSKPSFHNLIKWNVISLVPLLDKKIKIDFLKYN